MQDALNIPEWKEAVPEEMNTLARNETWEIVELPREKKIVGCKRVAKGFAQTYGIVYLETFSLVAKLNSIRVLLTMPSTLIGPFNN